MSHTPPSYPKTNWIQQYATAGGSTWPSAGTFSNPVSIPAASLQGHMGGTSSGSESNANKVRVDLLEQEVDKLKDRVAHLEDVINKHDETMRMVADHIDRLSKNSPRQGSGQALDYWSKTSITDSTIIE